MRRFLLVPLLAGCQSLPEPADLYGFWVNTTDGRTLAWEFAPTETDPQQRPEMASFIDTYYGYNYAEGAAPVLEQYGTFQLANREEGWTMVRASWWNASGGQFHEFDTHIVAFRPDRLTLLEGEGIEAEYDKVDELPGSP